MLAACSGGAINKPGTKAGDSVTSHAATHKTPSSYTPAGNAGTLLGIDSVGRGYRDDVAQLINDEYSADPAIKRVAEDFAHFQLLGKFVVLCLATGSASPRADYVLWLCAAPSLPAARSKNGPDRPILFEREDSIKGPPFHSVTAPFPEWRLCSRRWSLFRSESPCMKWRHSV